MPPSPFARASATLLATVLVAGCATRPAPVGTAGAVAVEVAPIEHPRGETTDWWFRSGAAQAAARGAMAGRARNVILFVGDGMSLTTVAAARIFEGQRGGRPGEENLLSWEAFPHTALSKTYNTDTQTPDSAGTMTAMATGVKTRMGVISVAPEAATGDCAAARTAPLTTLWELAAGNGLDVGIVSTTRVTHATPAATFSHVPDRNWEHDAALPPAARVAGCVDIARQMIESPHAAALKVLMGGGRANFMPAAQVDPEYPALRGLRQDGRDLLAAWRRLHPGGEYAWNVRQFEDARADAPLLALFEPSHMQFEHDRMRDAAGEPDLAAMTRAAIERLARGPRGYVLLVEAGQIDRAHHYGNAYRALVDTVALSDAVRVAARMTSADDTLIVVTADHSHTLTFAGYPARGNPILGKVRGRGEDDTGDGGPGHTRDALGLPYTTLGYANGPGYTGATATQGAGPKRYPHEARDVRPAVGRPDLGAVDTADPDYLQEAAVPLGNESHGGDDVGVWARGPGSHAVRGTLEQNAIFHILLQATPRLREAACRAGGCDRNGVPVDRPKLPSR